MAHTLEGCHQQIDYQLGMTQQTQVESSLQLFKDVITNRLKISFNNDIHR